jgi:hypothetical protein
VRGVGLERGVYGVRGFAVLGRECGGEGRERGSSCHAAGADSGVGRGLEATSDTDGTGIVTNVGLELS